MVLLGFVPVPVISQVSGVYANVEVEESRSAFLPDLSTSYADLISPVLACEGEDCTPDASLESGETASEEPVEVAAEEGGETPESETASSDALGLEEEVCLAGDSDGDGIVDCEDAFPEDPLNGASSGSESEGSTEGDTQTEEVDVQREVSALAEAGAVLLDEYDEPIPLTSEEALETLSVADPYFTDGSGDKYCYVPTGETCAPSCDFCDVSATPIQNAINDASAGTTIYMEQNATFTESFTINKSITLTSDGNNKPLIKSSNGEYIIKIENTDNVSIFDLELDGEGDSDVIGIWIINSGDIWLQGNEIVDTAVGVQIDNPGGSTKKVRIYENTIESKTSGSVGIKVNTIGSSSLFASLNTIQNDQYNVLDNSGKEDFELYFNDWGYVDGGGNYKICSMSGHTISDWEQLYNCAQLLNVLNSEVFLDGATYPDVFDQGLEGNGGLCIAEKNDNYAIKLNQQYGGTITLGAEEVLGAVGIKSADGCFYGLAPTTIGETVTVNGKDDSPCYEVTLYKREDGVYQYYFEKVGDGDGCQDISHMVGYYADPGEDEEEPEYDPLQLSLECLGEGYFSWKVTNPNDVGVADVKVVVDGNIVYEGSIAANGEIGDTLLSGITTSHSMEVTWEGQGYAATETDVCEGGEVKDLELSLVCLGVGKFSWSVTNPNDFEVGNVQVLIDGSLVFDGAIPANTKVGLGATSDGPATHTMVVTWDEEGYAEIESNQVCTDDPPPQDPPIPVTGTQFLIPVTGLDLSQVALPLSASLLGGGFSLLALSIAIGKRKEEDQ